MTNGDAVSSWNLLTSTDCSMDGYPGVDLIGVDEGSGQQTRISVPRDGQSPAETKVDANDPGGLSIEYMPGTSSSSEFKAETMIITPPGTYEQITYQLPKPWMIDLVNEQLNAKVLPISTGGHP